MKRDRALLFHHVKMNLPAPTPHLNHYPSSQQRRWCYAADPVLQPHQVCICAVTWTRAVRSRQFDMSAVMRARRDPACDHLTSVSPDRRGLTLGGPFEPWTQLGTGAIQVF